MISTKSTGQCGILVVRRSKTKLVRYRTQAPLFVCLHWRIGPGFQQSS